MPADADAPLAVEPPLSLPAAARVLEQPHGAGRIGVPEDHVGDELFLAGVLFDFAARQKARVLRLQQLGQIPARLMTEALKVAQTMKQRRGHNQHAFGLHCASTLLAARRNVMTPYRIPPGGRESNDPKRAVVSQFDFFPILQAATSSIV